MLTFIALFVPYIITVYKITTYIAVSKTPENFDSHCTFKESAVTFTVCVTTSNLQPEAGVFINKRLLYF